jgi:hypothetical protein
LSDCSRGNSALTGSAVLIEVPQHPGPSPHVAFPGSLGIDHALLGALVAAVVVAALAVGIILLYVGSVMRFVLFDSIIARDCRIRWSWSYRLGPGWRYFVWRLLYILLSMAGIVALVGIPAAVAFAKGWFKEPKEHLPLLVAGGIVVFLVSLAFFIATAVVLLLTKDFVVPQMALEDVGVMEGWRRLWPMMKAEKGAYGAYVAMKVVLAFVAAILTGIATVILGLIIAIPSMIIGILAVLTGKASGLAWNGHTIALAVVIGCALLAIFLYLVSLIYVPATVFFPAYSIHFFAGRYPRLRAVLYPAQPLRSVVSTAPAPP